MPPCRLRQRKLVHSEVLKNAFFACFRFSIFHPFFQGVSWPNLPLCADAHDYGGRATALPLGSNRRGGAKPPQNEYLKMIIFFPNEPTPAYSNKRLLFRLPTCLCISYCVYSFWARAQPLDSWRGGARLSPCPHQWWAISDLSFKSLLGIKTDFGFSLFSLTEIRNVSRNVFKSLSQISNLKSHFFLQIPNLSSSDLKLNLNLSQK